MEPLSKLALVGEQMGLEPAEDAEVVPRPSGRADPRRVAACGHSPAALRQAYEAGITASLAGGADPAPDLERKKHSLGVYQAAAGGRRVALLKTLLTSACERDCYYCPFRAGRNYRRTTFKPHEMAQVFTQMQQAGEVTGLFLSSGVAGGGVRTQDRLIDTIDILRRKHEFRGYVHLKLMPGAERDQVQRAMELADRVSVNLEAPNTARLQKLAPHKLFLDELLQPLKWVDEIRRTQLPRRSVQGRWPSLVTQFVVGAVGEDDVEILSTTHYLTRQLRLARVYFSAFSPVADTPLAGQPPENPWREHRLYQASFLMRDYGFDVEDMPFGRDGRLPLEVDPKLAWAEANLRQQPVELNRADREALLRVPGIGPKGVAAILAARRRGRLRDLADLRQLGIHAQRAAPYVLLDGRQAQYQMALAI
jgi:predicted DNA-binding helix-hairpin-helix protein